MIGDRDGSVRSGWGVSFGAGVAVFLLLQLVFWASWASWFAWQHVEQPWWLNSGRSIVVTELVVFAVSAALSMRRRTSLLKGAAALLCGLFVGSIAGLAAVGFGNLWPLALAFGLVMMSVPVALGAAAAQLLGRRHGAARGA